MHVAIFTDNDFDKVNGVTTTLRAVLEHAPADLDVRVYTASRRETDEPHYRAVRAPGVPLPFYAEMRLHLPRPSTLDRAVARTGVDVIHLTTPGPVGLAALRIARRRGVPLVGSFHTDLESYARLLSGSRMLGVAMRAGLRWSYGRCERVLVPSLATRQMLVSSSGDAARFELWTRGVDAERFSPAHRDEGLRRQWGVSADRPALVYVGRMSREKGLHLLPALARVLDSRGLPHRLVLVGAGPMEEELRARLPEAIFTGVLHGDRLAAAYASADVFVFPSQTDTAGNVVLEAQASGIPVLVSASGGPRENMVDGQTGHVVQEATPEAWLHRLAPLLDHARYREAMGAAARRYAEGRTWARALEPLFRTYRQLGRRSPAGMPRAGLTAPQVSVGPLHAR